MRSMKERKHLKVVCKRSASYIIFVVSFSCNFTAVCVIPGSFSKLDALFGFPKFTKRDRLRFSSKDRNFDAVIVIA